MQTPSIDLPPTVAKPIDDLFAFAMSAPAAAPVPAAPVPAAGGLAPPTQNFAEGGVVQPTPAIDMGVTPRPNAGPGLATPGGGAPAPTSENLEAEAKKLIREQPAMAAQLLEAALDAIEMGEFTEEMIMTGGKMGIVVSRNPDMYPKMLERMTAMGAKDLPPEYDPEFVFTAILLMLALKDKDKIQAGGAATSGAPAPAVNAEAQDFAEGGYVTMGSHAAKGGEVDGPGTGTSDSININVSDGEFIIPAHAVRDLGVEHFQKKYIDAYKPSKKS